MSLKVRKTLRKTTLVRKNAQSDSSLHSRANDAKICLSKDTASNAVSASRLRIFVSNSMGIVSLHAVHLTCLEMMADRAFL